MKNEDNEVVMKIMTMNERKWNENEMKMNERKYY